VTADRGYRGRWLIGTTKNQIPKPFNAKQSRYEQQKLKRHTEKESIEPVIDHLKSDHCAGRSFSKGSSEITSTLCWLPPHSTSKG